MSGQAGSTSMTGTLLGWLISPMNTWFEPAQVILRKTLHVVAYGLLGALDFRAVRGAQRGWLLRWSAIAVLLATTVASLDEWHQSYVPGRTATPRDVVIDMAGAMLAQFLFKRSASEPVR